MPVEIKLPQLGESIHEGTIARWLKKPGDRVEKYEPLAEITTDKVNVEMPSPIGGRLVEVLVAEGETRQVGAPIALIETAVAEGPAGSSEAPVTTPVPAAAPVSSAASAPSAGAVAPPPRTAAGVRLSPLVRKLAEEHRIPAHVLDALPGTGAGGRLTKDDLLRYIADRAAGAPAPPADRSPSPAVPTAAVAPGTGDEVMKLSPVRRAIAQRMAQSKREIPHAYGVIEVDMHAVVTWREAHKDAWRRDGVALTYTAFFIRAACEALRANPVVNSAWSEEGVVLRRAINIGVGIAVDEGLVVPVIRGADQLSLSGVARALDDLTRRARAGRLTLDDIQGGTFTLTNPGVFGSIWSMPIVVPGQAAILATDAIVKRAVVRDDAIAIRPVMHLGLSFDHRIFDGAVAMRFLNHMKEWFETFRDGR
ncbi:MAG: dihydrolipoamide acetyltransferase family protein [Armatimonadota bacterium]|nr:dihydrolipoamide acetyltransferase family protein [Armatimonadota bacterium]